MQLTVQGIYKQFYSSRGILLADVLRGVNLTLGEGNSAVITGPSGSGKSTLLNIIAGMENPDAGTVDFGGQTVTGLTEKEQAQFRNRFLGFVFQDHHLLPHLTALENILLPTLAQRKSPGEYQQRAEWLLEKTGLVSRRDFPLSRLSGGERQRIALARAFVMSPRFVLADEPTGALDTDTSFGVLELLKEIQKDQNTGLLLVTHSSEIAGLMETRYKLSDGVLRKIE